MHHHREVGTGRVVTPTNTIYSAVGRPIEGIQAILRRRTGGCIRHDLAEVTSLHSHLSFLAGSMEMVSYSKT